MSEHKAVEIACPACGQETLLLRKPRYEGLQRVGEDLSCSACGHAFDDESTVPFKGRSTVTIFTDADRSDTVELFDAGEARICRHCQRYVVNPFTQWCGLHRKEVEATDTCDRFERKAEEESPI